jgi:cell division protein FtsX
MILYVNIGDLIRSWQQNVRMVAYLKDEAVSPRMERLQQEVTELRGVEEVRFVS